MSDHPDMVFILGFLSSNGTGESIPALEKLAAETRDADLRSAAQAAVEAIRSRVQHTQNP